MADSHKTFPLFRSPKHPVKFIDNNERFAIQATLPARQFVVRTLI